MAALGSYCSAGWVGIPAFVSVVLARAELRAAGPKAEVLGRLLLRESHKATKLLHSIKLSTWHTCSFVAASLPHGQVMHQIVGNGWHIVKGPENKGLCITKLIQQVVRNLEHTQQAS